MEYYYKMDSATELTEGESLWGIYTLQCTITQASNTQERDASSGRVITPTWTRLHCICQSPLSNNNERRRPYQL